MSGWQARFLGEKVGDEKPSQPEAWQEVHRVGMVLYPEDPQKRRAFEDLCVMARVIPLSCSQEYAPAVLLTGSRSITELMLSKSPYGQVRP